MMMVMVLNLDESEVTTDGTSKWTGGRPTTKMLLTNENSTQIATEAHNSSYSATFIGGSNMAGWHILPQFWWIWLQWNKRKGRNYWFNSKRRYGFEWIWKISLDNYCPNTLMPVMWIELRVIILVESETAFAGILYCSLSPKYYTHNTTNQSKLWYVQKY